MLNRIVIIGIGLSSSMAAHGLTLCGSTTLLEVGQELSQSFQKANKAKLAFQHKSSSSFEGLILLTEKDQCDIARISTTIPEEKWQMFRKKSIQVKAFTLGYDAMQIVSYDKIKEFADGISRSALKEIYTTPEKDPLLPVGLIGMENSGTRDFFLSYCCPELAPSPHLITQSSSEMIDHLAKIPRSLTYLPSNRIKNGMITYPLKVNGRAITPTPHTILTGQYPLTRPLNFVIRLDAKKEVFEFIYHTLSKEGQEIIKSHGFFSVRSEEFL